MPALLVGLLCGGLNGLFVIRWRLPSFIVTLGMLEAARGAAYLVTQSRTIYIGGPRRSGDRYRRSWGLSLPFVDRDGGRRRSDSWCCRARCSDGIWWRSGPTRRRCVCQGIDPRPYKLAVFALCGVLTARSPPVIQTARMSSANPNTAIGFELQAIAAVVIGGTSLMGGRGSVVRSFFGVLIIAVLGAGLAQVGAQDPAKRLITGCVIVGAVVLDQYRRRKRHEGLATVLRVGK